MKITPLFPIVVLSLAPIAPVAAQLTPDNSLGAESSVVTPVNQTTDRIDGGAVRGTNLFHSFGDFNVDVDRSVYFANPPAIENILTRVTGGNQSNIMGTLGVSGNANLFLINPNGIVFGPSARLEIGGSFFATTGDGIKLGENGLFSATDLDPSELLQVRPEALFTNALANHMARLNNRGNLAVGTGSTLVLHGGEVTNSGSLTAPSGTVMVLGERIGLLDDASIDVSSPTGGGNIFIGGFLGGQGHIPTAARTYIGPDVNISANAAFSGDGGNIIVWADEVTRFHGNISARGGMNGGDGGFVEVSGARQLQFRGEVDTTAALGKAGTLLLDPRNIVIANGQPSMEIEDAQTIPSDIFNGTVGDTEEVTIYESQLEGLSGNTNVVLQATNDIVVEDLADDELSFAPGTGEIAFTADADGDGVGSFVMLDVNNGADTIVTNGRDIAISGATLTIGNIDARGIDNSVAPLDNAGDSLSTAQVISSGPGVALETIEGTFVSPDDVDLFGIYLSGSGTFSATVESDSLNPQLSLFDADGRGIYRQGFSLGLVAETPLTPTERGIYYLAMGNGEPVSEGGRIFVDPREVGFPEVVSASGPGGALPLSGWELTFGPIGNYTITLTGTQAGDTTFVESTIPSAISGNGGRVRLEATNGDLQAANLSSSSISEWGDAGSGGTITLDASGNMRVGELDSHSGASLGNAGNGGAIALTAGGDITTADFSSISSYSSSNEGTAGNGGEISLTAGGDIATSNIGSLSTSFRGSAGNGGAIALTAGGNITTSSLSSDSESSEGTAGNGGAIALRAGGNITTSSLSSSSFSGAGTAGTAGSGGAIALTAGGDITTAQLWSYSEVESFEGTAGNGGVISLTAGGNITTRELWSYSEAEPFERTAGKGTAGNGGAITLTAGDDITIYSSVNSDANGETAGNGGAIALTAGGDITANWISSDSSSNEGTAGTGGAIALTAGGDITTESIGSTSFSNEGTGGNGGAIALTAGGDIITNAIGSASFSNEGTGGNGGAIALTAEGDITIPIELNSSSSSRAGTAGDGGEILIEASGAIATELQNSGFQRIDSRGNSGGNITITSHNESVSLSNILLNSNAQGSGNSGKIELAADSVTIENTELNTSLFGKDGVGGNITITTSGAVDLDRSRLSSGVEPEARGNGGKIEIVGESVNLRNASLIDTATFSFSEGNAGDVLIKAEAVLLDNSSIFSITAGNGHGGNVTLGVSDTLSLTSGSNISTAANRTAVPRTEISNGGDIEIRARALSMTGGSQLQALTRGNGNSGNITIDVTEDISISGIGSDGLVSGVFTSTDGENSLTGGEINVATNGNLLLEDGAVLSAETASPLAEGRGGNINVEANRVELRNGGQLLANSSGSGAAGNITVKVAEGVMVTGVDPNFEGRPTFSEPPRQNVDLEPRRTLREIEQLHDSRENAQQLLDEAFSLDSPEDNNRMVEFSTRIPYVSIEGTGDDTVDVYSFEVTAGTLGVFDIDNGDTRNDLPSDVNTRITLFNERGEEVASNEVENFSLGGEGSVPFSETFTESPDPYIRYLFSEPGTYFIEVGRLRSDENNNPISTGIPAGGTYTLQVSLETANVTGSAVETTANSGMFARASGAGAAGNITVNAPSLTVSEGAQISATTTETATTTQPGGITINADRLNLSRMAGDGSIEAQTLGASPAGEIKLQPLASETMEVTLSNGFEISTSTAASGAGGDIRINAPSSVMVTGNGTLSAQTRGPGAAGNVTISTPSLNISEQVGISAAATPSATTSAPGGSITVNADLINLSGNSSLEAQTVGRASAGSITLKPFTEGGELGVSLESGTSIATISASTAGSGAGGNLNVTAPERVRLRGDGTLSVETSGAGAAGNVTISTRSLNLSEKVRVTATATESATTSEASGSITVNANQINLSGTSGLEAQTRGQAPAGSVTLRPFEEGGSVSVSLEEGTFISASTTGAGAGGNLNLEAPSGVTITGKGRLSVESQGVGRGGNATITTDSLRLTEGGRVTASSTGRGEAGSVNIFADFIELDNGFLEAQTAAGTRGNININTSQLRLFNSSAINTNATDLATGGNITIDTNLLVAEEGSRISANAEDGAGGNIQITAEGVFAENIEEQITASSDRGVDGTVEIQAQLDPARGAIALSDSPVDASSLISKGCEEYRGSEFIITGRGGIPPHPFETLPGEVIWLDWRALTDENSSLGYRVPDETSESEVRPLQGEQGNDEIRQAQGWLQLPDGTVVLTAYPVKMTPVGPVMQHPGCQIILGDRSQ